MEELISFIILLVISVIVSAILHYGLKYTAGLLPTHWAFANKVIVGYFGAWWGTTLYGKWLENLNYQDIYYIPAVLGAISLVVFVVSLAKVFGTGSK